MLCNKHKEKTPSEKGELTPGKYATLVQSHIFCLHSVDSCLASKLEHLAKEIMPGHSTYCPVPGAVHLIRY